MKYILGGILLINVLIYGTPLFVMLVDSIGPRISGGHVYNYI